VKRAGTLLVLLTTLVACHERPVALAPDLVVDFGCTAHPRPALAIAFLSARGFSALDIEQSRRNEGRRYFPLQIDANNRRRVMVELIGLQKPESYGSGIDFRLTITSPPPTVRDTTLEDDALRLVRDGFHCKVHAVRRFENGPDSIALFNNVYEDVQRRMRTKGDRKI